MLDFMGFPATEDTEMDQSQNSKIKIENDSVKSKMKGEKILDFGMKFSFSNSYILCVL